MNVFFERLSCIVKSHLKTKINSTQLNHEELYTLLLETEKLISNRPVTYVYSCQFQLLGTYKMTQIWTSPPSPLFALVRPPSCEWSKLYINLQLAPTNTTKNYCSHEYRWCLQIRLWLSKLYERFWQPVFFFWSIILFKITVA